MALIITSDRPGMSVEQRRPIVVELSDRRLPVRMRLGAMRSSGRIPLRRPAVLRRALMVPGTVILRLWSRQV